MNEPNTGGSQMDENATDEAIRLQQEILTIIRTFGPVNQNEISERLAPVIRTASWEDVADVLLRLKEAEAIHMTRGGWVIGQPHPLELTSRVRHVESLCETLLREIYRVQEVVRELQGQIEEDARSRGIPWLMDKSSLDSGGQSQ